MRKLIIALVLFGIMSAGSIAQKKKPAKNEPVVPAKPAIEFKSFEDSLAYAIGINIGGNLLRDSLMLNLDLMKAGLNDAIYNTQNKILTDKQVEDIFKTFSAQMQEKMMNKQKVVGEANSAKGKAFLEENKKNPKVKTTASGLQYEVITEGNGPKPVATDKVTVHYVGTTIDGKEFDSSIRRGEPASFNLNGVIKGWTEGVQLMSVGSKYKFYIPSELAYGERGAGENIGPNEVLIFEVELIKIGE